MFSKGELDKIEIKKKDWEENILSKFVEKG